MSKLYTSTVRSIARVKKLLASGKCIDANAELDHSYRRIVDRLWQLSPSEYKTIKKAFLPLSKKADRCRR